MEYSDLLFWPDLKTCVLDFPQERKWPAVEGMVRAYIEQEKQKARVEAEAYAKEGWDWVEEFCNLAGVRNVFELRDKLKGGTGE